MLRLPKSARLLKPSEFDRVFRERTSTSDGLIIVYGALGASEQPRLGLTVSRKCGNAVVRNRWKRSLREAFRLVQHQLPRHLDLVVLPRRGAALNVARLQSSLLKLATNLAKRPQKSQIPNPKSQTLTSHMKFLWQACLSLPRWIMIFAVRCYQMLVSPWLGPRCRFHPTCSSYFAESLKKYGAIRGGIRGLKRIVRCHPWNPGGYDPP